MILTKLISECRKTLRAINLECTTFREETCSVVVKATSTDKVDDNEKWQMKSYLKHPDDH